MSDRLGYNGGPRMDDPAGPPRALDEAQADPDIDRRPPAYQQRHAGPGAPLPFIVGIDALGRWTLHDCGH